MKVLLDTCAVIYWINEPYKFSNAALEAIDNPHNRLYLSDVSLWELALLLQKDKISFASHTLKDISDIFTAPEKMNSLPISGNHILALQKLPIRNPHKDPFDRLLICQALEENLAILTSDRSFPLYAKDGLEVVW